MLQNKIILKDGTEIIDGVASRSANNNLMVRIPGDNLVPAAMEFSNPDKTQTIVCFNSIYKYTFVGFTDMYMIQYFSDGNFVELWLRAPEGGETSNSIEMVAPSEYFPQGGVVNGQ